MSTKVKLFLLTLVGVALPLLANYLLNTAGFAINPYLMMGMMVLCLLLLVYNGTYGGMYGHKQGWGMPLVIFFTALNLLPALYYAFTLFPLMMASLLFV